jgi:hypothetical protein
MSNYLPSNGNFLLVPPIDDDDVDVDDDDNVFQIMD